jgi:hypothetical protein
MAKSAWYASGSKSLMCERNQTRESARLFVANGGAKLTTLDH